MQEERWGDVQDWHDWRCRNAAMIGQEICSHNNGTWPITLEEWKEAAARYGFHLYILSGTTCLAETHDDLICVRYTSRPGVLSRRICHEIAEAIAHQEGALRQFNFTSPDDEHHNVARLVENDAKRFAQAQARTVQREAAALVKQQQDMEREMRRLQEQIAERQERLRLIQLQLD